ncbi:hypothetical protein ACLBXB_25750 [Methylobacterium mesophilicum]
MTNQEDQAPKRRGRPRKAVSPGERKSISFRVTEDIYNWLVNMSELSGYSISEVVERQLENEKNKTGRRSLEEVFIGNSRSVDVLKNYSLIFATYDKKEDWLEDEATRAGILGAIEALNSTVLPVDRNKLGIFASANPSAARVRQSWEVGAQFGAILAGIARPPDPETDPV